MPKAEAAPIMAQAKGRSVLNPTDATRGYAGHHAQAAYSRWAPIYDLLFDLPFHPGGSRRRRLRRERPGPAARSL